MNDDAETLQLPTPSLQRGGAKDMASTMLLPAFALGGARLTRFQASFVNWRRFLGNRSRTMSGRHCLRPELEPNIVIESDPPSR